MTSTFGAAFPTDNRTVTRSTRETGALDKETTHNPTVLQWGIAVQYSLQSLQSFVSDVRLQAPLAGMIPLVELAMETCLSVPCQSQTAGTVNPGLIWFGRYVQLGIEARIPINDRTGNNVGVSALFHIFVDDVLDELFARPHHRGVE